MVSPDFVRYHVFFTIFVGCILKFLPPYSPDMNPIEESFSSGELVIPWYLLDSY
jgi:hypothetical protein